MIHFVILFKKKNFLFRTNTYPKSQAPERYRLRSSDGAAEKSNVIEASKMRTSSMHSSSTAPLLTKVLPNNHLSSSNKSNSNIDHKTSSNVKDMKEQNKEEEVIYF